MQTSRLPPKPACPTHTYVQHTLISPHGPQHVNSYYQFTQCPQVHTRLSPCRSVLVVSIRQCHTPHNITAITNTKLLNSCTTQIHFRSVTTQRHTSSVSRCCFVVVTTETAYEHDCHHQYQSGQLRHINITFISYHTTLNMQSQQCQVGSQRMHMMMFTKGTW